MRFARGTSGTPCPTLSIGCPREILIFLVLPNTECVEKSCESRKRTASANGEVDKASRDFNRRNAYSGRSEVDADSTNGAEGILSYVERDASLKEQKTHKMKKTGTSARFHLYLDLFMVLYALTFIILVLY